MKNENELSRIKFAISGIWIYSTSEPESVAQERKLLEVIKKDITGVKEGKICIEWLLLGRTVHIKMYPQVEFAITEGKDPFGCFPGITIKVPESERGSIILREISETGFPKVYLPKNWKLDNNKIVWE